MVQEDRLHVIAKNPTGDDYDYAEDYHLDRGILLSLCFHSLGHYSTFVSGRIPGSVSETVSRQIRDKDGNPRRSYNRRQ